MNFSEPLFFDMSRFRPNRTLISKTSIVTYILFSRDSFGDPDFIDENTLGKIPVIRDWTKTKPDGPGPNLEREVHHTIIKQGKEHTFLNLLKTKII